MPSAIQDAAQRVERMFLRATGTVDLLALFEYLKQYPGAVQEYIAAGRDLRAERKAV